MPRRRVQREQCDCLDCREGFPADTLLGTAVARQQPPPKCLVLYLRSPNRNPNASDSAQSRTPCLDAVVDEGCSAILALREGWLPPPSLLLAACIVSRIACHCKPCILSWNRLSNTATWSGNDPSFAIKQELPTLPSTTNENMLPWSLCIANSAQAALWRVTRAVTWFTIQIVSC